MSEEILNEIVEETTENIENEIVTEEVMTPQRVNPFCVVEKKGVIVTDINKAEHVLRDIQTNGAWGANPYGDAYAVVPDEMVPAIQETRGFVDIVLNEDGTEVVEFTAREIPEIPTSVVEHVPTNAELAEQLANTELTMIENYEAQEEINAQTENALIEIYEMMEV